MTLGTNFLIDFFLQLNKSQIRYCVLRNYQHLPDSTGESDLDILIDKKNASQFFSLLKDSIYRFDGKIVSFIPSDSCPRICVMGSSEHGWGLMIDLHYDEITYRGYPILTNKNVWKYIFKYKDKICALEPKADVLIGLLKELLNNGTCDEKYYSDFQRLGLDKQFLDDVFLDIDKPEITAALLDIESKLYSKAEIKRLAGVLNTAFPKKMDSLGKYFSKFKRLGKQPGFTIAFLGTDGSGKSTLIEQVKNPLNGAFHQKVYYEHMRPNHFPSLAHLLGKKENFNEAVTNPHESPASGLIGSLLRWKYYMLDYTLGYALKVYKQKAIRSCVWLFDRYYYDYRIDPRRARINLPSWILKLGQFIIPEPDLIFCLGTEPEIIHQRKPELPLEEVKRQTAKLKLFCNNHSKAIWIDSGQTVDKSAKEALEAIIKVMGERFQAIQLD